MTGENPLYRLVADSQPLDHELLAETIEGYIELQIDPPQVDFTKAWEQLAVDAKILAYLLGRKALAELLAERGETYDEKATPSTIEKETGIPGGSVRPRLSHLRKEKRIKEDNGYFVPNSALLWIKSYLHGKEDE